jgi:hypothetical protein
MERGIFTIEGGNFHQQIDTSTLTSKLYQISEHILPLIVKLKSCERFEKHMTDYLFVFFEQVIALQWSFLASHAFIASFSVIFGIPLIVFFIFMSTLVIHLHNFSGDIDAYGQL